MHLLAFLWFTLLHTLLPAGSSPAAGAAHAAVSAAAHAAVSAAGHASGVHASVAHATEETRPRWIYASAPSSRESVRPPVRAAALLVSQASAVVLPERGEGTPLERAAHVAATHFNANVVRADASRRHVVASRGDLLPYFPTAPPALL